MAKKQVKNHPLDIKNHIGNDFVFLYLQLIGYPDMMPGDIFLGELMKKYRFENLDSDNLYGMIKSLEQMGAFQIERIGNNEIIDITEESIKFIKGALDLFIERFIKGELIPYRGIEPYKFRKQRQIFLEKVEHKIEDSQPIMSLSDSDFDERFCFLLCFLAMVKQNEIEIVALYNEKNPEIKAIYNVSFRIKARPLKRLISRKDKNSHSLRCSVKGSKGQFQIKKNTRAKEIGPKNSRHYLLLEYLLSKGIYEQVNFSQAYNAIKDGKGYSSKKYEIDEELRVLENAQSALQKGGKVKPYQIIIDKETRKIWLEHI